MPWAPINGIDLYYEVRGSGPALLFAHGQGGNHLSWWQQVPFFSRSYTCITFDHRAFGLSHDRDGAGRRSFGPDVVALLQHLGVEDVRVVAQSMGGRTAVAVALRSSIPCRAVVFAGTNGGAVDDFVRERQRAAAKARGHRGLAYYAVAPSFKREHPELYFLLNSISRLNPERPGDFLALPPGFRGSTHERLAESGIPVLFLVGAEDAITPPDMIERCHQLVAGSRFEVIPGAGHSTYFERPDVFNEVVLRFLQESEERTPPAG